MILLIDNYDSFSYNLYQLIGEIEPDIRVIRNDEMTVEEIRALKPDRIILSFGTDCQMLLPYQKASDQHP
jgi:anthranilate synthase component II